MRLFLLHFIALHQGGKTTELLLPQSHVREEDSNLLVSRRPAAKRDLLSRAGTSRAEQPGGAGSSGWRCAHALFGVIDQLFWVNYYKRSDCVDRVGCALIRSN